ncbi:roundabout homolog 1-like isoform X1 [Paramuricea clavata]|uniref:Roundabout homolog 1-like isoform X1 n=1 Tax=Paramuricea clavata TaxID=317549 RepID=A0A7D9HP83_PARCT|nr:roundabout homolog 1-like isoform X1 [Paramuricea clavata]CAB3986468.1 roundabout homolog 1-like isoform X1 [Paramuricea clavata]
MVEISWVFAVLLILLQGNWLAGAQAPTITHQPQNTYAVKSGIAELICEATGTAPLKYKWYHKGVQVQSNERRRVLSNGHLYIKRVVHKRKKGISDTGEYYCTVTDDDRRVTKSRTVNISIGHIRKEFREHPMSQTVSRGGELTLTCISPRGKPKPKLRWLKDDRNVVVDGTRILLEQRSRLVIKNFKKEDEGSYQCEATNVAGRKLSNPAVITSTVPPTITSSPKDKIVDISIYSETTLTCKADGVPTPKIIWKKEGNNTILPSVDGTLTLTKLKPGDIGKYNCIAFNTEGNVSASVHLMLQYVPEFTSISPNVNKMEESTVKLKCVANGQPNPSIYWRKSDSRDPYRINHWYGNIQIKKVDRTLYLIFKPLKLSDAGNYTCEATNNIGTKTHNVNVGVYRKTEYAPTIVTPQVKISADINSNATIICDVEGNPKPTVKWSKIGQEGGLNGEISKDENIGNKHRYSLVINKVQKSNGGTFQCMASNKIKTITKRIVLQVSRKLHLSQPIIAGVPSMPKNVRVVECNDKSVRLSWDHSDDPVAVYAVGYIDVDLRSNEKYAAFDVAPNADQYVVQGLKANTRYMFFVRGINKIGRGVPSLLSDVVRTKLAAPTSGVLTPPTLPVKKLPKLNIKLSPGGAGELRVNWQKLDKSVDIAGYYIYWKVKGSDFQRETLQNDLSTRYTISDLQNSTKYIVRVQVFTEALKGPMSKSMHQRTSNKPVSLKMAVTQNDSDSMTVTWKRLWKKNSGKDTLKKYTIWFTSANEEKQGRRRKRNEERKEIVIPASLERYYHVIGDLTPGGSYNIRMSVSTTLGRTYSSPEKSILLPSPFMSEKKSTMEQIKDFIIQPWFLGVLGGVILILILILVLCCVCRRSSNKKDVDNLPIELQNTEAVRKTTSEGTSTESDVLTPVSRAARESLSECGAESYDGRSSSVYRFSDSSRTPTCSNLDFPNIAITPNKYERMYRSLEARGNDSVNYGDRQARKYSENDFDSPSRYNHRARNPYSPAPRPSCLSIDNRSDYDNAKPKCESTPEPASTRTPAARSPYPGEAPPDYETAIAENSMDCNEKKRSKEPRGNYNDPRDSHMSYKHDRYGNLPSRQSSCSPGSECSNQGSSIAGRRKGLKPPPRLTIASVNWADMLPPPPSHPPPASVATRSPPPSPTATSMCSETTYGRSHASSFHPRRSGSAASDFERADSVRSGKSKGKSENKLPFDLAGITSDIIMQWADSVTNTSGSEDESPCSSPDRKSGISSDGSFLTDTDFANAVKAAAECGGFNIDIDLNMYKAMDPISFQPFAGSLSTYNPESNSSIKPPSKKTPSKDGDGLRDSSRGRRARSENSRDGNLPSVKENSTYVSTNTPEIKSNGKSRNVNELPNTSSTGYVPALTRTSALGKLEPVKPVKKKYAVVRKLPQTENTPDYNYPSHSLSSSTSNASTVRSSSCPPGMLSDEDTEDDVI